MAANGIKQPGITMARSGRDEKLAAWWSFDGNGGKPLHVKIAVSFTSPLVAESLLAKEIPGWDFDRVRQQAQAKWNDKLNKVELGGVSAQDETRFYTALYHTLIQPRDRSADQRSPVKREKWDDHYTVWDTYRTLYPLKAVLEPRQYAAIANSFIRTADETGAADTAFIGGHNYHVGQGGDEVDNVLGEALLRAVPGIDWQAAYRTVKRHALYRRSDRYRFNGCFGVGDASPDMRIYSRARSGSSTLAFSLNDHYAFLLARQTGHLAEAAQWRVRSTNWRNVWNAKAVSDGFEGFIMPRHPDGSFQDIDAKLGWDGKRYKNVGFYEGTAWIYSFGVLPDIPGMVESIGGRVRFAERLRHALDNNLIDLTNEPSFATPWLFTNVGRSSLASTYANVFFKRYQARAYPYDEDNGAMSSAYVWMKLGLHPKLGSDSYYIHGPRHPLSRLRLENGRSFSIVANNASEDHLHVQAATLNGTPLDRPFLSHAQLMAGGTLELTMGPAQGQWISDGENLTNALDLTVASSISEPQPASDSAVAQVLFDGRTSTHWKVESGQPAWVSVARADRAAVCLGQYSLSVGAEPAQDHPKAWTLSGSIDGNQWVALDRQSDVRFEKQHATRTFPVASRHRYRYFKLDFPAQPSLNLAEVELVYAAPSNCAIASPARAQNPTSA